MDFSDDGGVTKNQILCLSVCVCVCILIYFCMGMDFSDDGGLTKNQVLGVSVCVHVFIFFVMRVCMYAGMYAGCMHVHTFFHVKAHVTAMTTIFFFYYICIHPHIKYTCTGKCRALLRLGAQKSDGSLGCV
jgi:hypothetical protein